MLLDRGKVSSIDVSMNVVDRDVVIRQRRFAGQPSVAIAEDLGVDAGIVERISIIAGLSGGTALLQQYAQYLPDPEAQNILEAVGWNIDHHLAVRPRCSVRDSALCDSILIEDITLHEAGQRVPFTREAMRQTLHKHTGLSVKDLKAVRSRLREVRRLAAGKQLMEQMAEDDLSLSVSQLAASSNLTADEVTDVLGSAESLRRKRWNSWSVGATNEVLLAEMRRVASMPGGTPLTAPFYDSHRDPSIPGSIRVSQRFQTWSEACRAAGVSHRGAPRHYERRWTEADLMEWSVAYIEYAGKRATYGGFERWLRDQKADGAPSAVTVRQHVGSWQQIVGRALGEAQLSKGRTTD